MFLDDLRYKPTTTKLVLQKSKSGSSINNINQKTFLMATIDIRMSKNDIMKGQLWPNIFYYSL